MLQCGLIRYIKRGLKRKYYNNRKGIHIAEGVDINNVKLGDHVNLAHHSQVSNSSVGAKTSIGRYSKVQFAQIGRFCSISWDVTIGALEHPIHSVSTHAFSYKKQFGLCEKDINLTHKETIIGNDVWIGCGAIIMPGVKIGDGAIVGAASLITKDVEPYEIVGGVPAKHLKWRFEKDVRERLLKLRWWDFKDDVIRSHIDLFDPYIDIGRKNDVIEKLEHLETMDKCDK